MNATPVFAETPNVAAPTPPCCGSGLKQTKVKPISAEFKQQLKNCLENEYAAIAQALFGSCSTDDNSMVVNSTAQTGIAGILEGFGLLDYQTDALFVPEHDVPSALPKEAQGHTVAADMAAVLSKWMQVNEKPTGSGMSEQFAWMLSNKQFNTLPPDTQQQILSIVKEYLGSLESTNSDKTVNAAACQTTLPNTDSAQDLLKLLLHIKTVQNPAPNAETLSADSSDSKPIVLQRPVEENAQTAGKAAVFKDSPGSVQDAADKTAKPQAQIKDVGTSNTAQQSEDGNPKAASAAVSLQAGVDGTAAASSSVQKADASTATAKESAAPQLSSEQPDFVRDNVVRIVDKISTQFEGGRHEFDVELKPEYLGKLNIKLVMENGNIRMAIKSGDLAVKGMICDQAPALQNLLRDKGITVTSIDISYQSNESLADGGYEAHRQNGRQSGGNKGSGSSLEWLTGTGLYDAMSGAADYYLYGSSFEYLA